MFMRSLMSLVLLLVVTGAVLGTGESDDCVSEQELTKVKEKMERRVDQLQSQLYYWQNVTINNRRDQCSSSCDTETQSDILAATIFNISKTTEDMKECLRDTNKRLDSMEDTITSINDSVSQPQTVVQRTKDTAGSFLNPADNCSHILSQHPGSSSGYYWTQNSPGYAVKVYCDMERVCGCGEGGGWLPVADIDMTRPNQACPTGFRQITTAGKTICGGQSRRCVSTTFSTHGVKYTRVCGRIIGYQRGNTDAFNPYITEHSHFVDGIILTHGSPDRHIWTFAAGYNQYINDNRGCPCNLGYNFQTSPFVGNDYFCDSGHRHDTQPPLAYLTGDPLWDGQGCVSGSCCSFNNPPWFCKNLTTPTTDDIELRLCITGTNTSEDMPFEVVELYVK